MSRGLFNSDIHSQKLEFVRCKFLINPPDKQEFVRCKFLINQPDKQRFICLFLYKRFNFKLQQAKNIGN